MNIEINRGSNRRKCSCNRFVIIRAQLMNTIAADVSKERWKGSDDRQRHGVTAGGDETGASFASIV
jgi:hypothetical protein